jgi:hypothetical protein
MFEIEGHKSTIMGLALGGISGFLLHKNLKLSKGYGIAIGSLLGIVVGFQITKAQAKKARELSASLRNNAIYTTSVRKNYSKECYDALEGRNMQQDIKPLNFEKDFLENCSKTEMKNKKA